MLHHNDTGHLKQLFHLVERSPTTIVAPKVEHVAPACFHLPQHRRVIIPHRWLDLDPNTLTKAPQLNIRRPTVLHNLARTMIPDPIAVPVNHIANLELNLDLINFNRTSAQNL